MAPGRQPRSRPKENDAGNRRFSVTSSEDVPVSGVSVPFEELLARELRKSEGNDIKTTVKAGGKAVKKPFLKRGARGWWMRQPGAKQKVVKHTLASKGEQETAPANSKPVKQKIQQQQHRRGRSSSVSSSGTLSPVATPVRDAPAPPKTLSPPVSPIQRRQYSNLDGVDETLRRTQSNDEDAMWKNASFRSTTSTDFMGMKNVRQSYEAKQEREANEMAEFEAIERDLAAEKEGYLMEKQQQLEYRSSARDQIHDNQIDNIGLPYSSFVSDLHEQERSRWKTPTSGSIFDDSLDEEADSALVFDDNSALSKDDWMSRGNGFTNQLRDHFGYGDPLSDLSAVSFDDSVPWDDGLSFQPQQSVARDQVSDVGDALNYRQERQDPRASGPTIASEQQGAKRGVYFADNDGDRIDTLGYDVLDGVPEDDAPVSSLVQNVFGDFEQSEGTNSVSPSYDNGIHSSGDNRIMSSVPPPPPVQDKSLSTLKQKLRIKHKPPVPKTAATKSKPDGKRTGPTKAKYAASSRASAKQKPGSSAGKVPQPRSRQTTQSADSTILPAVIEEKLYELEEEVKFYKAETLQLQKRKDYYEQEVKKLAVERDEFARYQQEQRVQIEKEWERERAKMKKEAKLQERQWKLRMNATISHQDRKGRGEAEMLKAQIVKMQLDEKARVSKWKAENENLRQRIVELEEKNQELSDEIKFLEKDRLEQWGKYERLLKEKQDTSGSATNPGISSSVAVLNDKSELRTMDDIALIKGTADELLQRWSFPNEEPSKVGETDHSSSEYHRFTQSSQVNNYNPKRYSLEQGSSHEFDGFTEGGELENTDVNGFNSDENLSHKVNAATTFEWALPEAEDEVLTTPKPSDGDADGIISASTSSLSENVSQEIEHPGGKKEILYADGSKKIIFPDGNEKEIDVNGNIVIKFTNGDHKEVFPDTGISVYYYYEARTKLTTYPDNRKVYEFPNQQIETSLPDGTTEIEFADGIKKTIRPNGDEFSVFPDGTTMLEQPDGLREVTLLNQKKIRYFPDGQMACVSPGGQETRVRSDSELQQLMEST